MDNAGRDSAESSAAPFDRIRVLELTRGIAGRTAGMLLADLGADVVRASDDEPDAERDPGGVCWDRGKVLTPLHGTGADELRRLADAADVLLTDLRPAEIVGSWASPETSRAANPRLVHAWLPPYAARGRWRDLPDDPLLLAAVGGFADHFPAVQDRPVAPAVPVVSYLQGALGAAAIAAALVGRGLDAPGRSVIVSGLHATAASQAAIMLAAEDGATVLSAGKRVPGAPNFRGYRGSDGRWLYLAALTPGFFFRALEMLDRMDILVREDVAGEFMNLLRPDVGAAVGAELAESFATRPRDAWLGLLADAGIPAAPVATRDEWLASEPVAFIGARLEADHPRLGRVVMPGVPVTLSATPGRVRHLPSAEHVAAASSLWAATGTRDGESCGDSAGPRPAAAVDLPLKGIRVLDISTFMAAPFAGTLLADFGADVVKVEPAEGDPYRLYSAAYTAVNQRKQAAALDLRNPDERGALLRLAAGADVLIDNLRASSMDRLGLGDEMLATAFPRLVRCSVSAYGRTGPFADLPGFDPVMQARSGMMAAQGGTGDPVASVAPVHDVATAALAALGILAALFARARTDVGQHVTASLAGSSVFLQCGELTTFAGRPAAQAGGTDFPGPSAVRRYYQACDGWLAVAATTKAHVAGMLSAVAHPEWSALADDALAGDVTSDDALAQRLRGVLAERPVEAWLAGLAAYGVPACRVLPRAGELAERFLVENEFSHVVADPVAGRLRVARGFSDWPGAVRTSGRPARGTTVGEETEAVLAAAGIRLRRSPVTRLRRLGGRIRDRVLDDDPHPAPLATSLPNRSRKATHESRGPAFPGTITQVTPAAASAAMASRCLPQSGSASCSDGSVYAADTASSAPRAPASARSCAIAAASSSPADIAAVRAVANSHSGPSIGIQPLARCATRRLVSLELPPIQIGIGCCGGRGRAITSRALKCCPA
jgi:crotonobetainyl-CoA:carnitine CoA-transferase CaiB-like acyl-CoA transferase